MVSVGSRAVVAGMLARHDVEGAIVITHEYLPSYDRWRVEVEEAVWLRLAPLLACYVSSVGLHRRLADPHAQPLREGRRFRVCPGVSRLVRGKRTAAGHRGQEDSRAGRERLDGALSRAGGYTFHSIMVGSDRGSNLRLTQV